jgi:hypothetical protein
MQYRLISQIPMHRLPKFSKTFFLISGLKPGKTCPISTEVGGTYEVLGISDDTTLLKSIIRCAGTFEFHQLDASLLLDTLEIPCRPKHHI